MANHRRKAPFTVTESTSAARRRELGRKQVTAWLSGDAHNCIAALALVWGVAKTQVIERCVSHCCEQFEAHGRETR